MKAKWIRVVRMAVLGLTAMAGLASTGRAQVKPCCTITTLDARSTTATARENAIGRTFVFKVTDAKLFAAVRVGQGVYANFATHQVSLDGKTICCAIVSGPSAPATPTPQSGPAPTSTPSSSSGSGSKDSGKSGKVQTQGTANKNNLTPANTELKASEGDTAQAIRAATAGNPPSSGNTSLTSPTRALEKACCSIIGIDRQGGLVSAKVNATGQSFQFRPNNAAVLGAMKIGEGVYANFSTRQVSLDGNTICCTIVAMGSAPPVGIGGVKNSEAQLSALECSPNQLPSGTSIHCTVRLDGKVPGPPIQSVTAQSRGHGIKVEVTTDKPALASPQTVVVGSGTDRTDFRIPTVADAQGGPIRVFASYQGMTKSAPVQLTAAMIKDFGCFDGDTNLSSSIQGANTCRITPWSDKPYGLVVHLAEAKTVDVTILVEEPGRKHHASSGTYIMIPASQAWGGVLWVNQFIKFEYASNYFEPVPQTENHTVGVRDATSGVTHSITFVVSPAAITGIGFGDRPEIAQNHHTITSMPGQKLKVWVFFNAVPAPTDWNSQNAWLDVRYGGIVDIQGPTNLAIREQDCSVCGVGDIAMGCTTSCVWSQHRPDFRNFSFEITVGACSAAAHPRGCPATVSVTSNQALGSQTGTINVIPQ
jgi:hypothetical protein